MTCWQYEHAEMLQKGRPQGFKTRLVPQVQEQVPLAVLETSASDGEDVTDPEA